MMTGKMGGATGTRDEARSVYRMFDVEGEGEISFAALKRVAHELGEAPSDERLRGMLEHARGFGGQSRGRPGGVGFDSFYRLLQKVHGGGANGAAIDDLLGDD